MRIAVFGLGYVGCVTAACLAKEGHRVIGVDVNPDKVGMIEAGKSPIVEAGLEEILTDVTRSGALTATTDAEQAVVQSDVSLICVGTPSEANGSLRLDYVRRCAQDIGSGLRRHDGYHVVVARSTMLPGSVESVVVPELETASGKKAGDDFGIAMNPEFLRESTSVRDFYCPPVTVIGTHDSRAAAAIQELYGFLDAPVEVADIKTAELVKYACNSFHALKVVFGNEIGTIAKSLGVDSHRVMDIFCRDTKLNLSSYYLKPGFAFGGSCLPKDLRALNYKARELDVDVPMLDSILPSNRVHIERVVDRILRTGKKRIGVLGLSFKAGTDDLRESPLVTIVETLLGKGHDIQIYDRNVAVARLVGANKDFIENEIPHISSLMRDDIADVVEHAEVLVIGNNDEAFREAARGADFDGALLLDLVRVAPDLTAIHERYEGVCW